MPFTTAQFVKARPFLFHLTDRNNIDHIHASRILHSAASLMKRAGDGTYLRRKRKEAVPIRVGKNTISIRDQQPLHAGNISFQAQWSFEDVIQCLNERVFFWPGTRTGPISYGHRHFERYADDRPVIIRVSTADLIAANSASTPMFCRFNSGSPRCSQGIGSPRGPDTFVPCTLADFTASQVVELTITESATLPVNIQVSKSPAGPWRRL